MTLQYLPVVPASTLNAAAKKTVQAAAEYAPIRVLYGRTRVPALIANVIDYNGSWVIQAIWGEGPIQAIESYTFGNNTPTGTATHYLGAPEQAVNATLAAAFFAKGVTYSDSLPGIAYSVFVVPGGNDLDMPDIQAVVQGRLVYDPRTTLTAYSTNPALCLADFASSTLYGMGLTVDYLSVSTVANACDATVGAEKRRSIGLALATVQESTAWLDTLATYAGCWAIKDGSKLMLVPDRPADVAKTFNHADGKILKLSSLKRRGISGMPTALEIRYTVTSEIPWRDASAWAYLPGVEEGTYPRRESQVALPGIQSASQAQREAIERLNKLTLADLSCTLNAFDDAITTMPGDVVSVSHPLGLTDKQFRVQSVASDLGRYTLGLLEYDPAVYSDTVVTDPTFADTSLANPLAAPAGVTNLAAVEEIYVAQDGAVASRLRVTWTPVTDLWAVEYQITLTRMTTADGANATQIASGTSVTGLYAHGPVEDGYYYKVSVSTVRARFAVVSVASEVTVQALGKQLPPANVASLTATITPTGLLLSWPAVQDIDFKGYRLKDGEWDLGEQVLDTSDTKANIGFVALGLHNYTIKALDWSGHESAVAATDDITLVQPAAVAPNVRFIDNDVQISWEAVTSSYPVDRYEVRYGTSWSAGTPVGSVKGTTIRQEVGWVSRQFWVTAFDAANNPGVATGNATALVEPYAGVTSLEVAVNGGSVNLTWGAATGGSLSLAFYEVRLGETFASADVLGTTQALAFSTPLKWSTNQTLWVVPRDIRGTYGAPKSLDMAFSLPSAPSVSKALIGVKVELSWSTPAATLPVKEYSVRYGASWSEGAATEIKIATTNTRIPISWAGLRTFFVAAIDVNGNVGTPSSGVAVQIDAPSAPAIDSLASDVGGVLLDQYRLAWAVPTLTANQLPIDYYVVGYEGVVLGNLYSTTYMAIADWAGERTFTVKAVDINGNVGPTTSKALSISPPTAPAVTLQVIDNNVLLYWTGSTSKLPVRTYELRKGSSWESAQLIGQKSGGFTTVLETSGGVYTYWVAAIDSAGTAGAPSQKSANVAQPPDYVLNAAFSSGFTGVKSNMVSDTDGSQLMGVNTTETWRTHFTSRGWAGPQAQVLAGYPKYIEPALSPSYYEEVFDYGASLPSTKVSVLYTGTTVSGTPVVACDLWTSPDNANWTPFPGVTSVYAVAFRYVRVRLTLTNGQYDLEQLTVTLDSKIKNDAGSLTASASDVGGTQVNFNVPFVDVASINVTPRGTTLVSAVYDFVDAPYPTGFKVLLFNQAGARVSGDVSWAARGY